MVRILRTIAGDYFAIARVCGFVVAIRWLWKVLVNLAACRRARNLQPADTAMGDGPFNCLRGRSRATLVGAGVFSGLREIWARNIYLGGDFVQIRPGATVLDLGANVGNFTLLALGHDPSVRVVAVEPGTQSRAALAEQLRANGWSDRVTIVPAFVGNETAMQRDFRQSGQAGDAGFLSQEQLIELGGLSRIDFLKCDVEGSEYDLLTADSPILRITKQLAAELHDFAGQPTQLIRQIEQAGFEVRVARVELGCTIIQARRREQH